MCRTKGHSTGGFTKWARRTRAYVGVGMGAHMVVVEVCPELEEHRPQIDIGGMEK